jgi:hypothetical protein
LFSESSATGSYSRSSQPSTASIPNSQVSTPSHIDLGRIRKRGVPIREGGTDTEGRKRRRLELDPDGINSLITLMKDREVGILRARSNIFERATELLQKEYETLLSGSHFLQAVEVLESESRASIFVTLKGPLRDQWLCRNAQVEFIDNESILDV